MSQPFAGKSDKEISEQYIQFLAKIYEASNGVIGRVVDAAPIIAALGVNNAEFVLLVRHAAKTNRVVWGNMKDGTETTGLTTAGVRFAEEIIAKDTAYRSDPAWQHIERKAMQSIKSYRNLTLIHQGLINNIVNGTRKCDAQGIKLLWMIADERIGFVNVVEFFAAKTADVNFLEERGWVEIEREANAGRIRASNKSHLANLRQFGRGKVLNQLSTDEHIILCSAYAEAGGDINQQFLADGVAKNLNRWTLDAISGAMKQIANKGYARFLNTHGEYGGLFKLTPEGAALAAEQEQEEDPMEEVPKSGDTYNIHHSTVGGIQSGTVNSSQVVTQTIGSDLQQVLDLLEQSKAHLSSLDEPTRKMAEEQIEHAKEEVRTGKPHLGKMKTYVAMAMMLASGVASFQTSMATVCEKLGVEKQAIEQIIHPKSK